MSLAESVHEQILKAEKQEEETISESKVLNPRQQLESKIDSIVSSIENLTKKKLRIETEIKKQKVALARKRSELKRVNKSLTVKSTISLESTSEVEDDQISVEERTLIQNLLRKSAEILEQ